METKTQTVTAQQAAERLGVNFRHVYQLIRKGKLQATKYPNQHPAIRVHLDSLERLIAYREKSIEIGGSVEVEG